MTFDVLLVALAALVLSNVVLLLAAARSGVLDAHRGSKESATEREEILRTTSGRARAALDNRGPLVAPYVNRHRRAPAASAPPAARTATSPAASTVAVAPDPIDVGDDGQLIGAAPAASSVDAAGVETPQIETAPIETRPIESAYNEVVVSQNAALLAASGAETSSAALIERPESAQPAIKAGTRAAGRRTANNGKRGRRFTLPSIEVDHERTERVVLSLLSGDDEPSSTQLVDAWERLVGGEADGPGGRSAVVVALALDGLDAYAESDGRDAAERLVGGVLDAIRRSARGSDRVASVGRGRFRVLLVDADSEVASRFVARVRELADRRISLSAASVRIAAGWAEATSAGSLDAAVRAAEDQRRRHLTAGSAAKRDVGPA